MAKKDLTPLQGAYFEGGKAAMDEHIRTHLNYPSAAVAHKIEGTVHLYLDIDNKGKVTHVKVISGIGYGCDEEAMRVVKLMRFKVEKQRATHIIYHHKLQIHFRLPNTPKIEPLPIEAQATGNVYISYVITPSVPKNVEDNLTTPKTTTIYTYTI
jgi:TonB family protein